MGKVRAQGMSDYTPEQPLDKSWYEAEILDAKADSFGTNNTMNLMIQLQITEGPTQSDGSEPEGRRVSDFIPLEGYETMKDGGKFLRRKLHNAFEAAGVEVDNDDSFDPDEFTGQRVAIKVAPNENPKTGEIREQVQDYRATD